MAAGGYRRSAWSCHTHDASAGRPRPTTDVGVGPWRAVPAQARIVSGEHKLARSHPSRPQGRRGDGYRRWPRNGCDAIIGAPHGSPPEISWDRKKQVENTSEFWADVSMVVVSPVAIAAGFAKGAYDAST